MKILSAVITSLFFFHINSMALAECDFNLGITETQQGYLYSPDCHRHVGKIVKDLEDRTKQVDLLNESISYKNQIIDLERQRVDLWQSTAFKMEDRISSIERLKHQNELLYFGMGILLTVGAAWAVGQASK